MSNNLILLSSTIITLSTVIHHSYMNYIQKYKIKPRYDIVITNFVLLFMGWVGLCFTLYTQTKNLNWVLPAAMASLIIYCTDVWMSYTDVKNAERSYDGDTLIKKSHPRNKISIPLLLNILGWLVLSYTILGPNGTDLQRVYSTLLVIGILVSIYYILPKSRKNNLADTPGYIVIILCWMGLYFLKKNVRVKGKSMAPDIPI